MKVYKIFLLICLILSCQAKKIKNAKDNKIDKIVDFENHIKWNNDILSKIKEDKSWVKFDDFNIKNAIKYIPSQGPYGSCQVNSSARAMVLINIVILEYDKFLNLAKLYASSAIKFRKSLNEKISKYTFNSLVKLQEKHYKNDKKINNNLLAECFESGVNSYQISKFINKYCRYVKSYSKNYRNFENCLKEIKQSIKSSRSIIGTFKSGVMKEKQILSHAMNIIGYTNKEFLILNTWGSNKVLGTLTLNEMKKCMNIENYYYLFIFQKIKE